MRFAAAEADDDDDDDDDDDADEDDDENDADGVECPFGRLWGPFAGPLGERSQHRQGPTAPRWCSHGLLIAKPKQ